MFNVEMEIFKLNCKRNIDFVIITLKILTLMIAKAMDVDGVKRLSGVLLVLKKCHVFQDSGKSVKGWTAFLKMSLLLLKPYYNDKPGHLSHS